MTRTYTYSVTSGAPFHRLWLVRVIAENRQQADEKVAASVKGRFRNGRVSRFLGCRQAPQVTWSRYSG